jgi:predicted nucleic acid-binding Zn ribbon protein
MALEIVGALCIGSLVLWLVFEPMLSPRSTRPPLPEPEAEEETRHGVALLALKEIEFDRATGKLSDADYDSLKARYSEEALAALEADERQAGGAVPTGDPEDLIAARLRQLRSAPTAGQPLPPPCPTCGPRPEPDALFCSTCGQALTRAAFCASCGSALPPDSLFCAACGVRVAA